MATIIKIRTWGCPTCGFHEDYEPENLVCPACGTSMLVETTDPTRQATVTIMDDTEIDAEVARIKKRQDDSAVKNSADVDLSTPQAIQNYKDLKKEEIAIAVAKYKKH